MDNENLEWLYNRRTYLKSLGTGATVGLAGCLGGGGGNNDGEDSGGTVQEPIGVLTWNLGFLEKSINGWLTAYEKKYGISAKWIDKPAKKFPTYFQTQLASGHPPECIDTQGALFIRYAQDGVLEPLAPLAPEQLMERFFDSLIELSTIDGKLYRIPFYFGTTGTMYRDKWFKEAGLADNLPKTTEEYFSAAETIANDTDAQWGMVLTRFDYALWPFFWAEGIPVLNDDNTKAAFNTPRTVEILTRFRELTADGVIPDISWTQRKQPQAKEFGTGNTGMYHMWLSGVRLVKNAGDWISGDTVGITSSPGGKAAFLSHGWSIPETHNKATSKAAMDMISIILNEKWQKDFLRTTTVLVANKEAVKDLSTNEEFRSKNPLLAEVYDNWFKVSDSVEAQPRISEARRLWDIINTQFTTAALGEKSPEQAVNTAEQRVNNLIGTDDDK